MIEYKVIALSVGGVGNQIFHSGDKVKEEDFHPGTIPSLIKGGYIVAVEGEAATEDKVEEEEELEEDLEDTEEEEEETESKTDQSELNKLLGKQPEPSKPASAPSTKK